MKDAYSVRDGYGDILREFPYTVNGLDDACAMVHERQRRDRYSDIININQVDLDCPDGLTEEENAYMQQIWGL